MNLLFYVPQMAAYGGMERHVCVLAREATQRGHRVRFLTTSNSLNETARGELRSVGIDFRELGRQRDTAGRLEKFLWLWRQTLAARAQHWDIIYTNGQSALASIVWKAARSGTRVIHHHHTAADAGEQETWAPGFRRVLARAPEIVGCSEATRINIEQATGRRRACFLPYFTACPVTRDQVAEKMPSPDGLLHFGFAGRLVETKGIDTICQLSQRPELAHVRWHIHGSGPDYPASHFEKFPAIQYHGPYRDLAQYGQILRGLDALVLFSRHNEGMPLSLIEALSAGLPWIASDRGGTREIAIRPENCVLVTKPADLGAVLANTLEMVRRLRQGETSRLAQRAAYDAHFEPKVVAEKWFRFLEGPPLSS